MANVKAVYSVSEVSEMMGLSVWQTLRRLKKAGVVKSRGKGARIDVPLVAFREAFPDLWESILLAQRLAALLRKRPSSPVAAQDRGEPHLPHGLSRLVL